jgi:hypothetical protein
MGKSLYIFKTIPGEELDFHLIKLQFNHTPCETSSSPPRSLQIKNWDNTGTDKTPNAAQPNSMGYVI